MKAIIVGMGVQGNKRKKFLGKDFIFSVDKFKKADFKSIYKVPLNKFDTAFVCVPDHEKLKIVNYCIKNKKNVLLEKPFLVKKNKHFMLSPRGKKYLRIFRTAQSIYRIKFSG